MPRGTVRRGEVGGISPPGPHPAGKKGRNVGLGPVYDPRRKLVWATEPRGQVWVLRFDRGNLDKDR